MNGIPTYGFGNYGDYYTIVTYGFGFGIGAGLYRLSLSFNLYIDQVVSIELER